MGKVYISGKITELPFDEVTTKFKKAEEELAAQGYEVVNPANNGIPINAPWELHVAMDLVLLIGCHAIYMLPDWVYSKRATLEKNIAELTGKTILYKEAPAFADIKQAITNVTGVSFVDIVGPIRERRHVYARMIFAHYCRATGATVVRIADEMKRDHSTVIYYLRKYDGDYQYNRQFRGIADNVKGLIKGLQGSEEQKVNCHERSLERY